MHITLKAEWNHFLWVL